MSFCMISATPRLGRHLHNKKKSKGSIIKGLILLYNSHLIKQCTTVLIVCIVFILYGMVINLIEIVVCELL